METVTEDIDKTSGIVSFNGFTFWHKAKIVKSYIKQYLTEKFPNSLIVQELNQIDFVILDENLPIEVQSTVINKEKNSLMNSHFEDVIRRQIEDNIENYNVCWFFFDMEYYRYLNESTNSTISMNLDWFSKYVKEDKIRVFTVKYDGLIKELKYGDLEFIRKLSSTCKLDYGNDDRILNRNKLRITNSVLKGYKFTQEEIDIFTDDFDKIENKDGHRFVSYLIKEKDDRKRLYGNILMAIGNLKFINDILNMNPKYDRNSKGFGNSLGIFEVSGSSTGSKTNIKDSFDICQYFPGYLRNKEMWNRIKDGRFSDKQLRELFSTFQSREQSNLEF